MTRHHKINYVELPCRDPEATKKFFENCLDWSFVDYGSDYMAFASSGIEGGFYRSEMSSRQCEGSALVILYSDDLESTLKSVVAHGATIVMEIFSFPGGRRFHFLEPSGNEFAVWSEE